MRRRIAPPLHDVGISARRRGVAEGLWAHARPPVERAEECPLIREREAVGDIDGAAVFFAKKAQCTLTSNPVEYLLVGSAARHQRAMQRPSTHVQARRGNGEIRLSLVQELEHHAPHAIEQRVGVSCVSVDLLELVVA